ncbi:retrovirus-related pol polyprotein from transposon TNT 1-94 [Tanacetum coccineum]
MQEELLQFKLQEVWTLVDLPNGKRAIGTKWAFRNKKDERGIVIRNKARLVAQGYTLEEWITYDEVFAPVARIKAIRLFLAYASFKDFVVYQMDVKGAFLYGKIEEEVYVYQPPGFRDLDFPDRVYKVEKAMYGLHQAPRARYETLSTYLLDNQFQRGKIDKTLFIKRFKGLQVQQKKAGIFISQDKYVGEILMKFGFTEVKTASTPMETQKPLLKDEDGKEVVVHMYRSMIGSLMYLISSRPDIMFAVLKRSTKIRPLVSKRFTFDLVAYTDSDYAGASLDRKSTTGELLVILNTAELMLLTFYKKSVRLMMEKLIGMEFELMLFWSSVVAKTINGEVQLHALVDGKRIIITETSCLSPKTIAWNEFSSTMASAIICLATNQKFNFSTLIFDSMVRNLDNLSGKFLMYPREFTSMDTEMPQSSGPTKHVADEAVHKERGDSLVRAATTASSLEAEQDSGNIDKTQSKVTLNEPNFPGTSSGSGLSGEDSLTLKELMELCTNLQQRVLDLEKTKTTQAEEIVSLKRKVKKLEHKKRSRTHMLKRLRKVGATARVEFSGGEESLGEDASKQGRINDIDADDDITRVSVHDVNVSAGKEEVVEVINTAKLIIDVARVSAASDKVSTPDAGTTVSVATTTITTVKEITLAQALANLKSTKPKAKGIAFREPGESTTTTTPIPSKIQDKGKAKMIEPEPVKKLSKKDQLKLDEEIALKLQAEIDEEERIARAEEEKIDEANIAWDDIQAKVDADYQLAERLQAEEQEQFTIEQKATLFKELLEQRRKHFAAKRAEEKRNKPPTKNQQKKTMITYLKNMEGWKHKDLKSKDFDSIKELFDKALKRVNMFVDFKTELVEGSSKRAGTKLEQEVTKKQKVDDFQKIAKVDNDQEAAKIKELMKIVSDEEEVAIDAIPLAVKPPTIVDWKIHTEGKKSYYQIIRADGKSQMYLVFSHMLKSFDREDLKTL